jgi:hypothetical protein
MRRWPSGSFSLNPVSTPIRCHAAQQCDELAPLHRADPKPKDHAEYSRSRPCIAAKAARSCPSWSESAIRRCQLNVRLARQRTWGRAKGEGHPRMAPGTNLSSRAPLREATTFIGTRRSLSPSQHLRTRRANMIFRRRHTLPGKAFKFIANMSDELINARTI